MKRTYRMWLWEKQAEKCVKNLKRHGFDAHFVSTPEKSRSMILDMVSEYGSFGFGGSDTVRQIGVLEDLGNKGKTIYDHWVAKTSAEDLKIRLQQGQCDCFFCSANAISMTGEIVNVDGIGNRTNAMTFGPRKVIIVAGMNKVTSDIDTALRRVREIAAPMRAKSLEMETPCAETGICSDCNAPQRICRVTTILHRNPLMTDISVILVGESLGF